MGASAWSESAFIFVRLALRDVPGRSLHRPAALAAALSDGRAADPDAVPASRALRQPRAHVVGSGSGGVRRRLPGVLHAGAGTAGHRLGALADVRCSCLGFVAALGWVSGEPAPAPPDSSSAGASRRRPRRTVGHGPTRVAGRAAFPLGGAAAGTRWPAVTWTSSRPRRRCLLAFIFAGRKFLLIWFATTADLSAYWTGQWPCRSSTPGWSRGGRLPAAVRIAGARRDAGAVSELHLAADPAAGALILDEKLPSPGPRRRRRRRRRDPAGHGEEPPPTPGDAEAPAPPPGAKELASTCPATPSARHPAPVSRLRLHAPTSMTASPGLLQQPDEARTQLRRGTYQALRQPARPGQGTTNRRLPRPASVRTPRRKPRRTSPAAACYVQTSRRSPPSPAAEVTTRSLAQHRIVGGRRAARGEQRVQRAHRIPNAPAAMADSPEVRAKSAARTGHPRARPCPDDEGSATRAAPPRRRPPLAEPALAKTTCWYAASCPEATPRLRVSVEKYSSGRM